MRPGDRMAVGTPGVFDEDAALGQQETAMMQRLYAQQPLPATSTAQQHQEYQMFQAGYPTTGGYSSYQAPQYHQQPPAHSHYSELQQQPSYQEPPPKYHPPYYQEQSSAQEQYHNPYAQYQPSAPYQPPLTPSSQPPHHQPPHYSQPPDYHDQYRPPHHPAPYGGGRPHAPQQDYGAPYRPDYPPRYEPAPGFPREYQAGHEYHYGYRPEQPLQYSHGSGYPRPEAPGRFPAPYDAYAPHEPARGGRGGPGLAPTWERNDGPPQRDERRPGDWMCPKCGFNCFASKSSCRECGEPKPRDPYLPSVAPSLLNHDGTWVGLDGASLPALVPDPTHIGQKKMEECKYFNMRGGCKRGAQCHFAHVSMARRRCPTPPWPTQPPPATPQPFPPRLRADLMSNHP